MAELWCFAYAGGGRASFAGWDERLPGTTVRPVVLPGRGHRFRERPLTRVSDVVDDVFATMGFPEGRFQFYGQSVGALIAFEVARELHAAFGMAPETLTVAARSAPRIPPRYEPLHRLDDARLKARLAELGGMPPEIADDDELLSVVFPVIRADCAVAETYTYAEAEPIPTHLVASTGCDDRYVTEADARAWAPETTGRFDLVQLPGGHFAIQEFPDMFFEQFCGFLSGMPAVTPSNRSN